MLHNSGGITQCFGSLIRAITRFPHMEAADLLDHLEVPSRKAWASEIGMPEIMMLKEVSPLARPELAPLNAATTATGQLKDVNNARRL